MTRPVAVGFAVLLLAVLAVGAAVGSPAGANAAVATPDGFDRSVFAITVYENGSADWTMRHHRQLENDSETTQFRDFADEFESNDTALYRSFARGADVITSNTSESTGREMNATNFSRDARVAVDPTMNDRGVVEMTFRWTNFAVVRDDAVVVSDVFGSGPYIGDNQRMEFTAGPNLTFTDARPDAYSVSNDSLSDSESVWWVGERQFGPNRPRVELAPTASLANGSGEAGGDPGGGDSPSRTTSSIVLALAVVVLAVGVAGAAVWRTRRVPVLSEIFGDDAAVQPETEPPRASEGVSAPEETPVPEDQLLSDDDRVKRLLEENGGRMKQVNIVEETEWSKSKVSMLLSDMEDEGEISKLRVGRENIISLAGQEPDAAGSPFDEE